LLEKIKEFIKTLSLGRRSSTQTESAVDRLAANMFLGKEGHKRVNCAQAIAKVFQDKVDHITEQTVNKYKKMGHGRAPGGACGMLFAAQEILAETEGEQVAGDFEQTFVNHAGSTQCIDIKKRSVQFCAECISRTALDLDEALT
jgi:hypothetical protein